MSDIRLHTFRNSRTRNGYARHDSSRQQPSAASSASANLAFGSHAGSPMPTTVAAAAAASSSSFSSSRRNKGRRRNDYGEGEPEEEATLLGEGERDPGFLHDDGEEEEEEERGGIPTRVERVHDAASQVRVRVVIRFASRTCDVSDRRSGRDQRTNLVLCLYDHQVRRYMHTHQKAAHLNVRKDKLQSKFAPNIVRNQKYNVFTFLPIVFYEQFKFFFNLYFLLVALSQFVPALRTGAFSLPPYYRRSKSI